MGKQINEKLFNKDFSSCSHLTTCIHTCSTIHTHLPYVLDQALLLITLPYVRFIITRGTLAAQ